MSELFLKSVVCVLLFVLALWSGFLFVENDMIGMSVITPTPNSKARIIAANSDTKYVAESSNYMPNPPSSNAIVLNRKISNLQRLKHCPTYTKCSKKCTNFRKAGLKPVWCTDLRFFEDTSFENIDSLELEVRTLFGKDAPIQLRVPAFSTHKAALNQLLSRIQGSSLKRDGLESVAIRYYFFCS